ncbi:FATC domain protein, partial [Teladorsagia circumcincta]
TSNVKGYMGVADPTPFLPCAVRTNLALVYQVYKHKFSCAPMSLEGQVAKLIDIASDEKNLAQMYIGWGPFI